MENLSHQDQPQSHKRPSNPRVASVQRAPKKTQSSFDFLNFVLDNLPVGLFCKDYSNDGRFTIWNAKCEDLFGYKATELIGKKNTEFLNADLAAHFLKLDQQCVDAKKAVVTEEHFHWPERGVDSFYRIIRLPVFDEDSNPQLVIGIAEDTTKEKIAEDKLVASQEFQDLLLKVAPVGICRFKSNGSVAYTNDKFVELFQAQWATDAVVDWKSMVHADDWSDFSNHWQNLYERQVPLEQIFRLSRRGGEVLWLKSTIIPLRLQDRRGLEYLGTFVDVTEVKNLQRLIQEQQGQMISASKMSALGEMAGGIAHEINNPLAIIRGAAELLEHGLESGKLDKKQLSTITVKIRKTVDRVAKIIRGLRSFSRDAEDDPLEVYCVNDILSETLDFCRSRLLSLQIKLVIGDVDRNVFITCRAVPISQVFLNLLNNATDAVVNLQDPWIKIEIIERPNMVQISFTDSGNGMSPKIAEKIMNPFFTTKAPGLGSGLGLSVSKRIVESHQGHLFLDEHSKHTRFVVELPKTIQRPGEGNEKLLS